MKPRNECDTDELWEVEKQPARTSIEVISEGQKGPLGFDLTKKGSKGKKAKQSARQSSRA